MFPHDHDNTLTRKGECALSRFRADRGPRAASAATAQVWSWSRGEPRSFGRVR
jgi:hypothetical protein